MEQLKNEQLKNEQIKNGSQTEFLEYSIKVNGLDVLASYSKNSIDQIFIPLLKELSDRYHSENKMQIVFLAAAPGTGKSTLAEFLAFLSRTDSNLEPVQALGLDGFHYHADYIKSHTANVQGQTVPMKEVKGCPETFDTVKLNEKLEQIRGGKENILWPVYDRTLHDVVEDRIPVRSNILLIEGNYFLLKEEPWQSIRKFADKTILLTAKEETLRERLVGRKIMGGSSPKEALEWYEKSDGKNVIRTLENSDPGDLNLIVLENNEIVEDLTKW